MRFIEPLKMKTYQSADGKAVNISKWGCVFLSTIIWATKHLGRSTETFTTEWVINVFNEAVSKGFMTDEMFVKDFKGLLSVIGLEDVEQNNTETLDDDDCDGIVFTKKHCFYFNQTDGHIKIEDPGYFNDVKLDDEGFFVRVDGSRSKDPDGFGRKPKSWKILSVE